MFLTKVLSEPTHNMTFIYNCETIPQPLGTDCFSKNMKTCGSTGPFVCWGQNVSCPKYNPDL